MKTRNQSDKEYDKDVVRLCLNVHLFITHCRSTGLIMYHRPRFFRNDLAPWEIAKAIMLMFPNMNRVIKSSEWDDWAKLI